MDDGSSIEDRAQMITQYPRYRYILKEHPTAASTSASSTALEELARRGVPLEGMRVTTVTATRGHASSLNILLDQVRSRYFLYLEDDWRLMPVPVLHAGLATAVDALTDTIDEAFADVELQMRQRQRQHPFRAILLAALQILQDNNRSSGDDDCDIFNSKINDKKYNKNNSSSGSTDRRDSCRGRGRGRGRGRERVHQVLFNEQSTRACAEGAGLCDYDTIGRGGWRRRAAVSGRVDDTLGLLLKLKREVRLLGRQNGSTSGDARFYCPTLIAEGSSSFLPYQDGSYNDP
jgi:hypothetical protein